MNTSITVIPDEGTVAKFTSSITVEETPCAPSVMLESSSPLRLSATRIKTFLTCPRQYRYRYVDKLPTVLTGALAFGKTIHQVIHDLHQWSICSNEPLHYGVALSNFARLWEKTVTEDDPAFKDVSEIADYAHLAEIILRGYVEAHQDNAQPFLLEFPFDLELEDEQTGQPYILSGTIDRIDQVEAGLVIVDFKTGKRKPSPRELAFDIQLTIYAYAAKEVFGQEIVEARLYHLRDQAVFHTQRGTADARTLLQVTVPEVIEGSTMQRFSPKLGYWCRYCEFREQCMKEGPGQALQSE